jgi:hypothetical protein
MDVDFSPMCELFTITFPCWCSSTMHRFVIPDKTTSIRGHEVAGGKVTGLSALAERVITQAHLHHSCWLFDASLHSFVLPQHPCSVFLETAPGMKHCQLFIE